MGLGFIRGAALGWNRCTGPGAGQREDRGAADWVPREGMEECGWVVC